ncbi:MAG TPA: hypothetical protein VJ872_05315 [Nocardioides sp.]|nr:hypothetical protein [Nocardioides sp.]
MTLGTLTWMLTALAAVVVLLTHWRLASSTRQAGVAETPMGLLHTHTAVGVLTILGWVVYLQGGSRGVGVLAVILWWVLAVVGLLILARWLPGHGRHSSPAHDDDWAHGPGLSILGHVGMLVGVCYFTWFYLADKL